MNDAYQRWKGWDAQQFGALPAELDRYFDLEMRRCGVDAAAIGRVIEVGFGNGAFASWVRAHGGAWTGLEKDAELVRRAKQAGYDAAELSLGTEASPVSTGVDLVVAFDVVEHLNLDETRAFLGFAARSMRAGGSLVMRIPSGDSPFSGAIFFGDVTHRTLLGSSAIRQLAEEARLEVVQLRPPAFPLLGAGPVALLRRSAVAVGRALVHPFIRLALVGDRRAVLTPNMIAVLRRPVVG